MSSVVPPLRGRDRRRTDLYGRSRRAFYGFLLLMAHAGTAVAASTQPAAAKQLRSTASSPAVAYVDRRADSQQNWVYLQTNVIHELQPSLFGEAADWNGLEGSPERTTMIEMVRFRLGDLPHMVDGIARVKNGLGVDVKLPGIGAVFLDIYTPKKRKKRGPGVRWSVNLDGEVPAPRDADAENEDTHRLWALGGSVDLIRSHRGEQKLLINPQLRFHLGDKRHGQSRFEATVLYGLWRPATEKVTASERVVQAELRWRFGG